MTDRNEFLDNLRRMRYYKPLLLACIPFLVAVFYLLSLIFKNIFVTACVCFPILLLQILFILAIYLMYSNKLKLTYSHDEKFNRILEVFDILSCDSMVEIIPGNHKYKFYQGESVYLYIGLPKHVSTNVDVYCMEIGEDKYYFFPDFVLISSDDFYIVDWQDISVKTNHIDADLKVKEYESVISHGKIRKDGKLDKRYNTRFKQEAYWTWKPLSDFGVISFNLRKEKFTIVTNNKYIADQLKMIIN